MFPFDRSTKLAVCLCPPGDGGIFQSNIVYDDHSPAKSAWAPFHQQLHCSVRFLFRQKEYNLNLMTRKSDVLLPFATKS